MDSLQWKSTRAMKVYIEPCASCPARGSPLSGSVRRTMGPSCEVLIQADDGLALDAIDRLLAKVAEKINRTRKGRVWDIWVRGRPVSVQVIASPPSVELSAGCNRPEDYDVVRELSQQIANELGGMASEPVK